MGVPVAASAKERNVGFAQAREVRIKLNGVPDIHDDDEGRIVVRDGADVGFGLPFGSDEGVVEGFGAAQAVPFFEFGGWEKSVR